MQVLSVAVMTAALAFGPVVLASSAPVLAEGTAAQAAPDWPAAFGTLGIGGVLAWFLWYMTSKGQPRLIDKFTAALETQQEAFAKALREEREEAKELAATRGAQIERLCGELARLSDELRRRPCIRAKEDQA